MSTYKGQYIEDGQTHRRFNLKAAPNKLLSYRKMRVLLNRLTPDGKRRPFRIRFVTMDGELVEWNNVVCTSRNKNKRTHTYVSTESHNYRTVKDCLVLMIDDIKITID